MHDKNNNTSSHRANSNHHTNKKNKNNQKIKLPKIYKSYDELFQSFERSGSSNQQQIRSTATTNTMNTSARTMLFSSQNNNIINNNNDNGEKRTIIDDRFWNELLLLEPNQRYLEKSTRHFRYLTKKKTKKNEDDDDDLGSNDDDFDGIDVQESEKAFKDLFGMIRKDNDEGGKNPTTTEKLGIATSSNNHNFMDDMDEDENDIEVRKCSAYAISRFSKCVLDRIDGTSVPHTNVIKSKRNENALKTLRAVVLALAKTSTKQSGVDIVHRMTTTTINITNTTTNDKKNNNNNNTITSSIGVELNMDREKNKVQQQQSLPSVNDSNRFFNSMIQKCCEILKSEIAHPKCKLESLQLLAALASCKENVESNCLFAYLVSDQKNGDAVYDAIVDNVLKNDILAKHTLWQDACFVLALLLSWEEGQNRVAARTATATDAEASALLRAISYLMTKSNLNKSEMLDIKGSSSATAMYNRNAATISGVNTNNLLATGWSFVTKALGLVEDKINASALAQAKMFPNSSDDVCGALCIARSAQFLMIDDSTSLVISTNEENSNVSKQNNNCNNKEASKAIITIANILDHNAALIGASLMHGVLSNCVALRLPRAWMKKTSFIASESLHGVALGDYWRDALGATLVFLATLARERDIEKNFQNRKANLTKWIVGHVNGKKSLSDTKESIVSRRKTLATTLLCCFQRLVDDSASLEFLCSLSCLDCARPIYSSTQGAQTSGEADMSFISNLASSKGLLNARVKLNRPFIAAILETCSEICKFGEYFGAIISSRAIYICHQICSVKAANRSFICDYSHNTNNNNRRGNDDDDRNNNISNNNDNDLAYPGKSSTALKANFSRVFEAIACTLELCSKAHEIGKSSNSSDTTTELDEFRVDKSPLASQLVNLVNLFLAKPNSSCDSIADIAELVEILVLSCPKLTPLLNVGPETFGELRMQSIAYVYNALKSAPKEKLRIICEREIAQNRALDSIPITDHLSAHFALRSGNFEFGELGNGSRLFSKSLIVSFNRAARAI